MTIIVLRNFVHLCQHAAITLNHNKGSTMINDEPYLVDFMPWAMYVDDELYSYYNTENEALDARWRLGEHWCEGCPCKDAINDWCGEHTEVIETNPKPAADESGFYSDAGLPREFKFLTMYV